MGSWMSMSEEIVGSIKVVSTGAGDILAHRSQNCYLFFTPNRVIVAKSGSTYGWGFAFGAIGEGIAQHAAKKRMEEIKQLSVESILNENKKNFGMSYVEIDKVEIKKPGKLSGAKISFFTNTKKYDFLISEKKDSFDTQVDLIRSMLSSKTILL